MFTEANMAQTATTQTTEPPTEQPTIVVDDALPTTGTGGGISGMILCCL